MRVRLTQIDGKLPNLALMKLAHFHRARGDAVTFARQSEPDLMEGQYDLVYGSAIFKFSAAKIERFLAAWPGAIIGGTGTNRQHTIEDVIGAEAYEHYDYSRKEWLVTRGGRYKDAMVAPAAINPEWAKIYGDGGEPASMPEAAETAIKPCPFCGSADAIDVREGPPSEGDFSVVCRGCGASAKWFENDRQAAIDAWNRRAP